MKLWQYIKGPRTGKEAHQIELEAMRDPFLADALEGYEKTPGNHQKEVTRIQKEITRLQERITSRTVEKKTNHLRTWGIVAGILIVVGAGTWFVLNMPQQGSNQTANIQPSETKVAKDTVVSILPIDPSSIAQSETAEVAEAAQVVETAKTVEDVESAETAHVLETPKVVEAHKTEEAPKAVETVEETPVTTPEKKETIATNSPDAQPVTGMEAYKGYLQRNLKHPTDEECRNVKGNVVVVFKVGQSGRPYNIRVEQGLCASINKEAIRLIINGPDWKKGINSDEAKITIAF